MLRDMPKAKGTKGQIIGGSRGHVVITGGNTVLPPVNGTKTLKELGITLNQSSRWQKIAATYVQNDCLRPASQGYAPRGHNFGFLYS